MNLHDIIYNWLQLKLVADVRPNDEAAQVSLQHVTEILYNEHQARIISLHRNVNEYVVVYTVDGDEKSQSIPVKSAEILLEFINENPERYDF